ncbi:MAG: HD domain-containing protein [Blastocatellia bacterium]|nr:HD domain-containing protein [Blastocatellia bacterium]
MPKENQNERPPSNEALRLECESLAPALDAVEGYTVPHATRIAAVAERVARAMGLTDDMCFDLRLAALVHDIGEQTLHMSFLRQDRALNFTERLELWRHPVVGEQQAAKRNLPIPVQLLIRWHHENWDGTGYPDGLRGEHIPLPARILRAADVYSTLTSLRPFRPAYTPEEALNVIRHLAGFALDPMVVEVLLHLEKTTVEALPVAQLVEPVPAEPQASFAAEPPEPVVAIPHSDRSSEIIDTGRLGSRPAPPANAPEESEITAEFSPVSAPFNEVNEMEESAAPAPIPLVVEETSEITAEFVGEAIPFAVSVEAAPAVSNIEPEGAAPVMDPEPSTSAGFSMPNPPVAEVLPETPVVEPASVEPPAASTGAEVPPEAVTAEPASVNSLPVEAVPEPVTTGEPLPAESSTPVAAVTAEEPALMAQPESEPVPTTPEPESDAAALAIAHPATPETTTGGEPR